MKCIEVDVAIVGAGSAGMSAYKAARAHTDKVVVIEQGPYGTTCARVGCMPSKLLIAAAGIAHAIDGSAGFGITVAGRRIDGAAVMARVRRERDRFVGFVLETVDGWPEAHRIQGQARFLAPGVLCVNDDLRVNAARIVIATGATPNIPAGWRERLGDRLIVNDDVFNWATLPDSVAVVGTGVVGLELAQALHRLGVRVRLFGRGGRAGPLTDPVMQSAVKGWLQTTLPYSGSASNLDARREGEGVVVEWQDERQAAQREHFDYLLAAAGRRPALSGLDLDKAGIPLDDKGLPRFDRNTCRIGDSPVFIAGDADNDRPLLHEAADEGRIAGHNAGRYPEVRSEARRTPLNIVFTEPQMAMAGASHAELTSSGAAFAWGEASFADQGRARVMGRNQGVIRVYGDRADGRIRGAELFGPDVEHLAHLLAWSIQRGDTVSDALACPFYHPVLEEGLRTALQGLARALRDQADA
ncbi:dihydrolipoyl dehydrogenase [Zoogloea sp.]|uniref:dihydrolipoyl dehydrogenase n=1 Tax=Zoogloea sp. TaxID=49181 RepID=UPI0035B12A4B